MMVPRSFLHVSDRIKTPSSLLANIRPNFRNCFYNQRFTLPSHVIEQLLNTENGKVYQKLIHCCKFFFSKQRRICVDRVSINLNEMLEIVDAEDESDILIAYSTNFKSAPSKLWLIKEFVCTIMNENWLHRIFPKIYRSDIEIIHLRCGDFTESEFDFLVNPKKKGMYLENTRFVRTAVYELNVAEIVRKVPNATKLRYIFENINII